MGHVNQVLKTWRKFKEVIREEYKKMLGGGTAFQTSSSEGYSMALAVTHNSPSTDDDGTSFP